MGKRQDKSISGIKKINQEICKNKYSNSPIIKEIDFKIKCIVLSIWSLGQKDPLEEEMATHSSILTWKIPQTEEPGSYSPYDHKELDTTE